MSGGWVFVCGPSGAGKDSVLAWARQHLSSAAPTHPGIVFARRFISRPAHPGSDHDPLDEPTFARRLRDRSLAWHWQTHGLHYGVSADYARDVACGRTVVVNGSREHVLGLPASPGLRVVQITAAAEELFMRLHRRGREAPAAVAERMARNARFQAMRCDHLIRNDGVLAEAGQCLANYLCRCAAPARAA